MQFSIDWLEQRLSTITDEKQRAIEIIFFIANASDNLLEGSHRFLDEAEKISKAIGYSEGEFVTLYYRYHFMHLGGQVREAAEGFRKTEEEIGKFPASPMISLVYQMLAFGKWEAGQREKAFEYCYTGLKMIDESSGDWFGWSHFQLGVFHFDLKDFDAALGYFTHSEKYAAKHGQSYACARSQAGIAGVKIAKGDFEGALHYTQKALEGFQNCGHRIAESRALNDLGVINKKLGKTAEAEKFLREALSIRLQHRYTTGIITSELELGELLMKSTATDEGEMLLQSALQRALENRVKQKAAQAHKLLSDLYKEKGDPWKALEHLERFFRIQTEISGEESSNRLKNLQQKFATENADKEAEIHRLKNVELKKAYGEIEEKNKSIVDSINYAKRIQQALLPTEIYIERVLNKIR